jgi:hypothetical protein
LSHTNCFLVVPVEKSVEINWQIGWFVQNPTGAIQGFVTLPGSCLVIWALAMQDVMWQVSFGRT